MQRLQVDRRGLAGEDHAVDIVLRPLRQGSPDGGQRVIARVHAEDLVFSPGQRQKVQLYARIGDPAEIRALLPQLVKAAAHGAAGQAYAVPPAVKRPLAWWICPRAR